MTNVRPSTPGISPWDSPTSAGRNGISGGGLDRAPAPATANAATGIQPGLPATNQEQTPAQRHMLSDLLHWEGDCHHLYRDSHGLVTVGIGNLVGSAAAATTLPFVDKNTGRPATAAQVTAAFEKVRHLNLGQAVAGSYAGATSLRLPEETVRTLCADRLSGEFLPALRRDFPGFDGYPVPAQRALCDMAYNLGAGGLRRFHQLCDACKAGDWSTAAAECHRRTCRAERNDWTKNLFLEAAKSVADLSSRKGDS